MHSIIIPVFNGERFIKMAIQSCLDQSYKDIEIIVSDNDSSDASCRLISDFHDPRIRLYKQRRNIGMVGNWNFCLQKIRGSTFQILCADDFLEPSFLEILLLNKGKDEIIFCNSNVFVNNGSHVYQNPHRGHRSISIFRLLRKLHGIPLSSLIFNSSCSALGFSDKLMFNADFEFVYRCMVKFGYKLRYHDEPLVNVLIHEKNETKNYNISKENLRLLRHLVSYTENFKMRQFIYLKLLKLRLYG